MSVDVIDLASSLATQKQKPPHVTFERRPIEDKAATKREGRYIAKDIDYAIIMAPYSDGKESVIVKVHQWFENLENEIKAGRYPAAWLEIHRKNYERFKQGQEIPLNGVPIKGWGVISPAQQEMLIHRHILTVEELAGINDVGMGAIGMGAMDLKRKAVTWLAQTEERGPLTIKMTDLEKQNDLLTGQVETLTRQVQELLVLTKNERSAIPPTEPDITPAASMGIKMEDISIMNEAPPVAATPLPALAKRPRGNPNWRKKAETPPPEH